MFRARPIEPAAAVVWSDSVGVPTVWLVPSTQKTTPGEDAYLRLVGLMVQRVRKLMLHESQEEFAGRMGLDKNTVSRWENGKTSLSAHNLTRLWRALGVPADWLLDPTDSVTELDRRIGEFQRVASEAARAEAGEGPDRPSDGASGPRRGRS